MFRTKTFTDKQNVATLCIVAKQHTNNFIKICLLHVVDEHLISMSCYIFRYTTIMKFDYNPHPYLGNSLINCSIILGGRFPV
jgi:hypothetical protein